MAMIASTRVQRTSFSATQAKASVRVQARSPMVVRAASIAAEDVPTPEKRSTMNLLLAGAVGLPVSYPSNYPIKDNYQQYQPED
jgi:hypothetical protein